MGRLVVLMVTAFVVVLAATISAQRQPTEQEVTAGMLVLAQSGRADAQTALGIRYALGKGVTRDYAEGARWLRTAAEQGGQCRQQQPDKRRERPGAHRPTYRISGQCSHHRC